MDRLRGIAGFTVLMWMLLSAETGLGQSYEPAVEYMSLLNMGFYNQTGGFMVDNLQIVFPPQNEESIEFVISKANGDVVATVPLQVQPWQFPVFDGLRPGSGQTGIVQVGQPGDYVISVKVGSKTVTTLPFTMNVKSSGDPFNPKKSYTREGPWSTLAFISIPTEKPDEALRFNLWTSLREASAEKGFPKCTVHLMQDGQTIATSKPVTVSRENWQPISVRLIKPTQRGRLNENFTMADLTRVDDEYTIVVKAGEKVIKSYAARVEGGELQRLARCQLDTQPHTDFISPRRIDTSQGSGSRNFMVDAYWVEAKSQR